MRHTRSLALAGIALLGLTACGPSEEEQAMLDALDCEDGESAEECGERRADEMMEDAPDAPSFSNGGGDEVPAEADPNREMSSELTYDQSTNLDDPETGEDWGTFTVNHIDPNHECDGETVVAVQIEINTINNSHPATLSEEDFFIMDVQGEFHDGVEAGECGGSVTASSNSINDGLLVFDTQEESGFIGLENPHTGAYWGW